MSDVTRLLQQAREDAHAQQQLLDLVYDELHRRAEVAMRGGGCCALWSQTSRYW